MTKPAPADAPLLTDDRLSRLRLVSGLILFAYVTLHFLNHSIGLISVEAMEAVGKRFRDFWRFPPMTILLYGALAVHFSAAIIRIYSRRTLVMSGTEWLRLLLGVAIPFLLVLHVMGTRYAAERYGVNDTYTYLLLSTFVFSPWAGWLNAAGLIAAWAHGCLGLYLWARLKPWYSRAVHEVGFALSILLPCSALAGFLSAGRATAARATNAEFMADFRQNLNVTDDQVFDLIARDVSFVRWSLVLLFAGLLAFRLLRPLWLKRDDQISLSYVDGPTVRHARGMSVLELSQIYAVPHASVCGGRGRCSTCRIRVLEANPAPAPPDERELRVLRRIGASDDVRLACQVLPVGDMKVVRLLPSDANVDDAVDMQPWSTGQEKLISVMFADLRDFTATAETRLPFDVVYLINQFSRAMGIVVEEHDGRIDKFLGDGFMALFGVTGSAQDGAKNAVTATARMIEALAELNERLADDLDKPLRMGIGLHCGQVILGDMGYGQARGLTAIGDAVNTASRLETATKELDCVACISATTAKLAGLDMTGFSAKDIAIRGKSAALSVYTFNAPEQFSAALAHIDQMETVASDASASKIQGN